MKKGQFITDRNLIGKPMSITWDEVWGDPTGNRRRNSKNLQPETGNGLLMVRGKFHLEPGEKVTLRVTALGTFDVCVNGQRIGTEELKPEWTDYRFRIFEYEYDITPYPGTALYSRMQKEGRILTDDLSLYNTANVVFRPLHMTEQELYDGYLRVYKEIYSLKNILKRIPKKKDQRAAYLMFNLLYRKYGKFTDWLCKWITYKRIGILAEKLSHYV